jgi:hypothetical protein
MIVRAIGEQLWLFDQRDHSALCGEMAGEWGVAPFHAVPPPVQRAAEMHDSGWPEWDRRPRLDPETGRPHPYSRMPDEDYHAIWQRGLARGWSETAETGLLVSQHAMRFFGHKRRTEDRKLFEAERERQREALRRLGAGGDDPDNLPEPYATWHAWMFFWDGLSLFLCEGWKSPWLSRLPTGDGGEAEVRVERMEEAAPGGSVTIEPFPFRAPLALEVAARRIPDHGYGTQEQLDAAVAGAENARIRWAVG